MVNLKSSPYWEEFQLSNKSADEIDWNSFDLPLVDRRFNFGTAEKSLGFAAGFLGAIAAVVPLSRLTRRFGVHRVQAVSGLFASVFVALTPFAITWSFPIFIVLRVLQGITFANLFTTAGVVVNEWATVSEKGLFIAVLSSHVEMGAVFTMPVSGAVAASGEWFKVTGVYRILSSWLALGVLPSRNPSRNSDLDLDCLLQRSCYNTSFRSTA